MEKEEPKFHTLYPREMQIRSLGHTFKVVQQYGNPHICRMLKKTLPGNQARLTNHSQGQALNFHLEIFSSNSPGGGDLNFQGKHSYSISVHYRTQGHFLQLSYILLVIATPPPSKKGQNLMCERNQESKVRYRSPSFSEGTNSMKITYQIKKNMQRLEGMRPIFWYLKQVIHLTEQVSSLI